MSCRFLRVSSTSLLFGDCRCEKVWEISEQLQVGALELLQLAACLSHSPSRLYPFPPCSR